METISKAMGESLAGKGELYAALAYDSGDAFGGLAVKAIRWNPPSGSTAVTIGDSTTAVTLATYAQRAISIYTTCASADGSNNVLPVYIDATMSGTGGVGRALEAKLTVSGKLGGWGNAIKGYLDVTATNGCSGLISGICAELRLPSASIQTGTYAVLELNWVGQGSTATLGALTGSHTTLIYANVGGGTATDFDARGYIFEIEGLSDSDGNAWYDNTLRIAIGDTAWYVPLSSAQGSFTTAYPIVSTYGGGSASANAFSSTITNPTIDASGETSYGFSATINAAGATGWSGGQVCPIFGQLNIACVSPGDYGTGAGGWFELIYNSALTADGVGLTAGAYIKVENQIAAKVPTSVLYLEEETTGSGVNATMPMLVFASKGTDVDKSRIAIAFGFTAAGADVATGTSGYMYYGNTIRCSINNTAMYLLFSTVEATFTTAYPIVCTSTLTVGASAAGTDVKFWGEVAADYLEWDASRSYMKIRTTQGSGGDNVYSFNAANRSAENDYADISVIQAYAQLGTHTQASGASIVNPLYCTIMGTNTSSGRRWRLWVDNHATKCASDSDYMIRISNNSEGDNIDGVFTIGVPGRMTYLFNFEGEGGSSGCISPPHLDDAGSTKCGWIRINTTEGAKRIQLLTA